jgi:hypothetical protein
MSTPTLLYSFSAPPLLTYPLSGGLHSFDLHTQPKVEVNLWDYYVSLPPNLPNSLICDGS